MDTWQIIDDVFAYETNGFGGRFVMDDANVPARFGDRAFARA